MKISDQRVLRSRRQRRGRSTPMSRRGEEAYCMWEWMDVCSSPHWQRSFVLRHTLSRVMICLCVGVDLIPSTCLLPGDVVPDGWRTEIRISLHSQQRSPESDWSLRSTCDQPVSLSPSIAGDCQMARSRGPMSRSFRGGSSFPFSRLIEDNTGNGSFALRAKRGGFYLTPIDVTLHKA